MVCRVALMSASATALAVMIVGGALFRPPELTHVGVLAAVGGCAAGAAAVVVRRLYAEPLRLLTGGLAVEPDGKHYVGGAPEVRTLTQALNAQTEQTVARRTRLEEDRRRLAGILGGMIEGVVALDDSDRVVFANDQAGELLAFEPARAGGRKFWEVVRLRPVQELVRLAAAERQPRRAELDVAAPAPRSLSLYASPLPGEANAGLILVAHDVSELRRLERLRQEFVANVSHELKTPLSVIKACVETLADGAADDPVHRVQFLAQVDEQTDRLHALILDLLNLGRIESGAESFEPESLPLEAVATECVERHRARAEAKHIRLTVTRPAGKMTTDAWADHDAVATILDNLVDNAIKYTPNGGSIEVRWGGGPDVVWLEVADNGVGIPETDLPRVFERFYRVDKARARELGGTGLGLTIVKYLAQTLGGSVVARSTPGEGSSFTVRLPAAPALE